VIRLRDGRIADHRIYINVIYERGGTDAAFHNADTAVRLARRGGGLFGLAGALITRAELAGRLGDADAARAGLTEARAVLQRSADRDLARQLLAKTESRPPAGQHSANTSRRSANRSPRKSSRYFGFSPRRCRGARSPTAYTFRSTP
jgi:hypothetical protein